jgi:hypothetical protein
MTHERVSRPLGRIAELLVENHAKVSLNEIRDLLQALDARAYWDGFQDGRTSAGDRSVSVEMGPTPVGPTLGWVRYRSEVPRRGGERSRSDGRPCSPNIDGDEYRFEHSPVRLGTPDFPRTRAEIGGASTLVSLGVHRWTT